MRTAIDFFVENSSFINIMKISLTTEKRKKINLS